MGNGRHGQGGTHAPGNVVKCFLCCKCCLTSQLCIILRCCQLLTPQTPTGELPLDPLGDFRPSDHLTADAWKILRAPISVTLRYGTILAYRYFLCVINLTST